MPTIRTVRLLATAAAGRRRRRRRRRRPRRRLRRPRRRERHHPADQDDDARRLPRRRRALRHQLRVHRRGRGGRLDHPAARRPDRRRCAAATGRCSASPRRWRRPRTSALPGHRRRRRRSRVGAEVILETKIDALDITVLKGGGDEVGRVGARQRLPPHARRARDARLLRPPQPDLHGRPLRRLPRRRARPGRRRRHADHAHDPDRPAVGAAADPQPRPRGERVRRGRRVPAHRRAAEPAGRRPRPHPRPQRGAPTTCCSSDLRSDVGMEWVPDEMWFTYLQVGTEAGALDYDLAISADPTTPPTITDTGVEVSEAQPVLPDGGRSPLWPHRRRRAGRPDRGRRVPRPRRPRATAPSRHEAPPLGDRAWRCRSAPPRSPPAPATRSRRPAPSRTRSGPGLVTVEVGIDHSRFDIGTLRVREGTTRRVRRPQRRPDRPRAHRRHARGAPRPRHRRGAQPPARARRGQRRARARWRRPSTSSPTPAPSSTPATSPATSPTACKAPSRSSSRAD